MTTEEGFAKTLSTIVSCLYCHNQHIVTHALGCFSRLSREHLPPQLLNLFAQALCDAVPMLLAYCSAATRSFLLEQLLQFVTSFGGVLSLQTTMKIMEAVFINCKHDEEGPKVGEKMVNHLVEAAYAAQESKQEDSPAEPLQPSPPSPDGGAADGSSDGVEVAFAAGSLSLFTKFLLASSYLCFVFFSMLPALLASRIAVMQCFENATLAKVLPYISFISACE